MRALTQDRLLRGWEDAVGRTPTARAVALAAAAGGHTGEQAGDLPLGTRDALLADLRDACFGGDLDCLARCPACGAELEVAVPPADLRGPAAPVPAEAVLEAGGHRVRYRALTSRDLLAVGPAPVPAAEARRRLVARCVLDVDGTPPADGTLPEPVFTAVAEALPALDPRADIRLDLTCAVCAHVWAAPVDVAAHVWADVDACARGLLADVHVLARAYGWHEEEILALSPARRRFYLEAVGA
ncbi:hypothetical protein [Streptomyces sp. NPDC048603]|uniref:hypothetical protein n=1 Tax=Streptomyces sp. NPDC048603 TaxID=3365577 RepID=UPI00372353B4